jgi:dihydrodipicolinate synthase/N-acetylneuraminate lyase
MKLSPSDLKGVLAMMPGFATDDANKPDVERTVDVDRLQAGVKKIVNDGVDVIAAGGSFGEGYAMLDHDLRDLARGVVEAAGKRVPVFVGALGLTTRHIVRRARIVVESGADGILLGLPGYFPQTVENAVRYYEDVAALFPSVPIFIYHNPLLFRTFLPLEAFKRLAAIPNVMGMKDSHRDTRAFVDLQRIVAGRISVFVGTWQYYPYAELGAAGLWSYHCWMGPWPVLRLRDAVRAGDTQTAAAILQEVSSTYEGPEPPDVRWRETAAKIAIRYAGYCDPGPLRHPFVEVPAEVDARARAFAAQWQGLCAKYVPAAQARAARAEGAVTAK